MTAPENSQGITVEYVERKRHHIIYRDGVKKLYLICCGLRREGERWDVLDCGYAKLTELRGTTKDAAIARAITMLRDGELDRMLRQRREKELQALSIRGDSARAALADARHQYANDPLVRQAPPRSRAEAKRRITLGQQEIEAMNAFLAGREPAR